MPDKALTGNYQEDFINKRKTLLELWLNYLSSHPVICESEVFIHFLQVDEANQSKWKAGKRKAEKDEYRGVQWFCTLSVPNEIAGTTVVIKDRIDRFIKSSQQLDHAIKNFGISAEKFGQFQNLICKREISNFGKKIEEMGAIFGGDIFDSTYNAALSTAIVCLGCTYSKISSFYGEQTKEDIIPLLDRIGMYKGVLQQLPLSPQFERQAISVFEEFQQKPQLLCGKSLMEVIPRKEITTHAVLAEMNLFNTNKTDDFAQFMKSFLRKQINFYTNITDNLKSALANFEKIPNSPYRDFSF